MCFTFTIKFFLHGRRSGFHVGKQWIIKETLIFDNRNILLHILPLGLNKNPLLPVKVGGIPEKDAMRNCTKILMYIVTLFFFKSNVDTGNGCHINRKRHKDCCSLVKKLTAWAEDQCRQENLSLPVKDHIEDYGIKNWLTWVLTSYYKAHHLLMAELQQMIEWGLLGEVLCLYQPATVHSVLVEIASQMCPLRSSPCPHCEYFIYSVHLYLWKYHSAQ